MKLRQHSVFLVLFCCCTLVATQSELQNDDSSKDEEITPYQYKYTVKDQEKMLFIKKSEMGDDKGKVKGSYSVLQADGRLLTVDYEADKDDGFVPKISYQNVDPFEGNDSS